METSIPISNTERKFPSTLFQASLNFFCETILSVSKSKELMIFISLSYIPRIKARVPPDIPGMTSAIPIAAPCKKVLIMKLKSGYYTFKERNEQNIF